MRSPLARSSLAALLATTLVIAGETSFPMLRWVDIHWTGEWAKDTWGRWVHGEDWSGVPRLPDPLDYRWLKTAARPVLLAHALGDAGLPGQNSLPALQRSLASGVRLLEVDLWLDAEGHLRCHRGPSQPPPLRAGDCRFEDALRLAQAASAWLVLDLKTDFATTGNAVVSRLSDDAAAERVVFQLYKPGEVAVFAGWIRRRRLAGPIVTAYLARRSLNHVATHAARIGVQAFTMPLYRLPALGRPRVAGLALFVHPVHDCQAARDASGADGFYVRSSLAEPLRRGCVE